MANESVLGRLAMAGVRKIPPRMRYDLIFGGGKLSMPTQKLLNRLTGGAHPVQFRFEHGPLQGISFECQSNEKYCYMREDFEPEFQQILQTLVHPGMVVYDVGAHIGIMSLLMAALGASVFCFEPSSVNFARLQKNLQLNPQMPIYPQHAGASDRECESFLSDNGTMSTVSDSGLAIRLVRLDDFVYRDGHSVPSLLKIDVEGHGYQVLKGMPRILSTRPTMVIEIHDSQEASLIEDIKANYRIQYLEPPEAYPFKILATAA